MVWSTSLLRGASDPIPVARLWSQGVARLAKNLSSGPNRARSFCQRIRANEISATVMLAAALVAMWGMIRAEIAPRAGGLTFMVGWGLLLIGILPVFVLGNSPEWFVVAGLPGNILALIGMTMCAVYSWRRRTLPRIIAALLPFSILIGVGLGEFGGSIVIAIVWGAIAMRLSQAVRQPMPADA